MKQCDLCNIVGKESCSLITNQTYDGMEYEICYLCRTLVEYCIKEKEDKNDSNEK